MRFLPGRAGVHCPETSLHMRGLAPCFRTSVPFGGDHMALLIGRPSRLISRSRGQVYSQSLSVTVESTLVVTPFRIFTRAGAVPLENLFLYHFRKDFTLQVFAYQVGLLLQVMQIEGLVRKFRQSPADSVDRVLSGKNSSSERDILGVLASVAV